jgi:hypothetical protein
LHKVARVLVCIEGDPRWVSEIASPDLPLCRWVGDAQEFVQQALDKALYT